MMSFLERGADGFIADGIFLTGLLRERRPVTDSVVFSEQLVLSSIERLLSKDG